MSGLEERLAIASCGPLFDAIPVPAVVTRMSDDTILAVNAEAAELTRAAGEDAIGRSVADFYVNPDDRARLVDAVRHEGRVNGLLVPIRRADGQPLWVRVSARLVSVDGDAAILSVFSDVSEQVATEHALRAATRAKTEFLASMSHELRTPLNGILGYAEVLQRDGDLTGVQREGLDVISRCGGYLLELINDVLDLSRIEAGRADHEPAPTDLRELLADVMHMVADPARARGLRLVHAADEALPRRIVVDGRRLRQVLLNLLGNAIKFTEAGEVRLAIGRDDSGRLRFEVADTGPGIEPENLGIIFEAFRQTSRGAAAGGTGLGLTISERLVRTMGGRLQVASTLGVGTRFFFSLPLEVDDRATAGDASDTAELSLHARLAPGVTLSALVVDDNALNRRVLSTLLEGAGIRVITAGGGIEGLEQARRHRPDVILMDWLMPDLNGFEAVQRMRSDPATLDIPVLAVTASPSRAARDEALRAGCIDLLSKPVRVGTVFARLRRHLGVPFIVEPSTTPPPPRITAMPAAGSLARELRAAAALGDLTSLTAIARDLGQRDPSLAPLARQVSDLTAGFDFEALMRLAAWLESYGGPSHVAH
jgi:PAS domain S-box-containing protein